MRRILLGFILAVGMVTVPIGGALATTTVDCDSGDSLQTAVDSGPSPRPIEILGTCAEQIVINSAITIIGGSPDATIDATTTGTGNAVTINSDGVNLRDLTIRGAQKADDSTGHGVQVTDWYTFSMVGVTVEDNENHGVDMLDSLATVTRSRIRDNGGVGLFLGGGCCGILTLDDSVVARNGGTGVSGSEDQSLIISNSLIKNNGGVGVYAEEDLHVVNSEVRRNGSTGVLGGTGRGFVRASNIVNNSGGGVFGIARVIDSRVARNTGFGISETSRITRTVVTATDGPGIECPWECHVEYSTIKRNKGSGLVMDSPFAGEVMEVFGSDIAHNVTSDGTPAAIDVKDGGMTVSSSTVRKNVSASGAAIRSAGELDIRFATIWRNSGPAGVFENSGVDYSIEFGASILYGHVGATDGCTGNLVKTYGYNVISEFGCPEDDTDFDGDPQLKRIAYNGGPTLNYLPKVSSPAIDRVPLAACTIGTDQRGADRPSGAACDSGAVERKQPSTQPGV